MLKLLPLSNLNPTTTTKCGEIFSHNFSDFIIFCTICQMKSFQFEDFLQHLQNVHLECYMHVKENVRTSELNKYTEVKVENILDETQENMVWNNIDQSAVSSDSEGDVKCSEEEKLTILKKGERKLVAKVKRRRKKIQDVKYDESSSDDLKVKKTKPAKEDVTFTTFKKKSKDVEYSCPECQEIFAQKKYLDHHVIELHNGYKCSLCDKRFRRSCHVSDHLKIHTTEKKYICPMEKCGRGFIDEQYLKRHLEVHTMERTLICDYENCGKAFQTNRRLASHQYTHRVPKKFVCDMCGHGCRSTTELTTHQRVHTGEKPFPCEVCNKPFISKTALAEHMISHSETRPHVCPVCGKAFANRRVMVRHSFIHSEEKTFKCKLCTSAFRHPNSLQGHMRNVHRETKLNSTKNN